MIRTALFLPASRPRAIAKARALDVDMVILDLEDAVPDADKVAARKAAVAAVAEGFGAALAAIRVNGSGTTWHDADLDAVAGSAAGAIVVPKVERAEQAERIKGAGRSVFAMIETPAGVLAAPTIAAADGVAGLIAGTNDLAASLRLSPGAGRKSLQTALQTIVLAGRAHGRILLDGVYNRLDDADGFAAECREGRALGFDGKTLIHPSQIETAASAFAPDEAEIEEARALVASASGGAERFEGRMIEAMHVDAARRTLAAAERAGGKIGAGSL